ncbi:hypothetical protein C8F04DRAFT_1188779 [Mycena alexandri]|uniref:Uncharacterized protein n=1 Tax=Mycena alexandri TaxID=1745969 RepID=A0AAD6WWX9_9AGAR|nr:hypothetical protein C8F04DRAFT_1188779 [Mycena alexandri]
MAMCEKGMGTAPAAQYNNDRARGYGTSAVGYKHEHNVGMGKSAVGYGHERDMGTVTSAVWVWNGHGYNMSMVQARPQIRCPGAGDGHQNRGTRKGCGNGAVREQVWYEYSRKTSILEYDKAAGMGGEVQDMGVGIKCVCAPRMREKPTELQFCKVHVGGQRGEDIVDGCHAASTAHEDAQRNKGSGAAAKITSLMRVSKKEKQEGGPSEHFTSNGKPQGKRAGVQKDVPHAATDHKLDSKLRHAALSAPARAAKALVQCKTWPTTYKSCCGRKLEG